MPSIPGHEDQRSHHGARGVLQSTIYSPWWRGVGNSASLGESTLRSSSPEQLKGSVANGAIQSHANDGSDSGVNFNEDIQIDVAADSDGRNGQEHHVKHVLSSAPLMMRECLERNSEMELAGHSIVLTPYPYSNPQYGGMLTSYGQQAMVPPQFYGMHHTRMPLTLKWEKSLFYVNAKQYHGILRRRQSRAKAELEKKVIKGRKPYLHESRHLHAMKRARGCGGRFLNTKKLKNNGGTPTSEKGMNGGGNHSTHSTTLLGLECFSTDSSRKLASSNNQQEGIASTVQDGHDLLSMYHSSPANSMEEALFGQRREIMQGNGVPNGTLETK
ncbi:nuclear transcription factor Y subunit A-1-like isoform X2 [Tripterygium wilfordii]|uniref:nuclear transcription factor Y subunit A-1-like isoform X2 n=1 Tax=Tripterygium wilfordii TaxID=458696 RepID=UPI0018F8382D|nr:nuclear transcription factor Y subunit A-1-like isoform X2 [Tripterygium wilfordii]